jgi:hypothetical protein
MNDSILQKTKSLLQVEVCIYQEHDFLKTGFLISESMYVSKYYSLGKRESFISEST